jgi:DNA-binding CsgD family transcriptional regulator
MTISGNGKVHAPSAPPAERESDVRYVALCLDSIDLWHLTGRIAEGRDQLLRAASLVPAEDTAPRARIAEALGMFARSDSPHAIAIAHFEEARLRYREIGDRAGEARVLVALGPISIDGGHGQSADTCRAALRLARDARDPAGVVQAMHALAWLEIEAGNEASAESLLVECDQMSREAGDELLAGRVAISLGAFRNRAGRFAEAEEQFRRAEAIWGAAGYREGLAEAAADLAALALFAGRRADAIDGLRRSAGIYRAIGIRHRTAELIDTAAGLALLEGDRAEAHRWLTTAAAYRRTIPLRVWSTWSVHLSRWLASDLVQGLSEPVTDIRDALHEVDAYLSVLRPNASDGVATPRLSRRERQVLGLVAAGLSDQAIADRLFIGRRTASRHVSAILRKLGLPSRTAAAVQAVREGLLAD